LRPAPASVRDRRTVLCAAALLPWIYG
jgi:hypothetical protein